ncbi:MAG: M48 family metalloprotease [Candidatus Eremiobacteraeota bacterium]|nr:M48 family metalloprotease [Candidatus Eremiobacteraeota bacterium]
MRAVLSGLAGGFVLGYATMRTYDALVDIRSAARSERPDARAYGRERRRLMLAGLVRSLATAGWMAFALVPPTGGDAAGAKHRVRRLLAVTAATIFSSLLELPSDYIEDHVLERRYALSKQTARAWLIDRVKALCVATIVTLVVVEIMVSIMRRWPRAWPWLVTAATVPMLILGNLIAPVFILPWFNTYEPIRGELEERLRRLARRYGVGDAQILRVDMSRQTEKANACVMGLFGTHRIVVGDTLLHHFTADEIEFVVAHELGHYVHCDVWRSVAVGTSMTAFILLLARALSSRSPRTSATSLDGLARLFFYANVVGVALGPLGASLSRSREWAADRFAVTATDAPGWGVDAFRRLRDRNLSEDQQPRWMEILFASHPSLRARIAELEALRK